MPSPLKLWAIPAATIVPAWVKEYDQPDYPVEWFTPEVPDDIDYFYNVASSPDRGSEHLWFKYGKSHRDDDRPAIIEYVGRHFIWCKNGLIHREGNKPAIINYADKEVHFRTYGLSHNTSGPAIVSWDSKQPDEWYLYGWKLEKTLFDEILNLHQTWNQIPLWVCLFYKVNFFYAEENKLLEEIVANPENAFPSSWLVKVLNLTPQRILGTYSYHQGLQSKYIMTELVKESLVFEALNSNS